MSSVKTPKKLIEVALPLDAINLAAAKEKSIRHGHPSTLHLWWARRPLAAARAVLFAQLVNDPGYERNLQRGVNKEEAVRERERLFGIIEKLVLWENTTNESVLDEAREEIWRSWRETCELNRNHPQAAELFNPKKLPAFHDPFAGGGTIPLEAQRLGLESYASDLNPVAVTINKAMIEIPPKFAGRAPVGPPPPGEKQGRMAESWPGASGLAEDVRRYGTWMRDEALQRIGHLYPKIEITCEMAKKRPDLEHLVGSKLTVIAWIWARTVKSPNPAYSNIDVPLVSSFMLSTRVGKEAYLEPTINGSEYQFSVRLGAPENIEQAKSGTKLARGAKFQCILSGTPISPEHIKSEGCAGRLGTRMMAIVAEGKRERVYIEPTPEMEAVAKLAIPVWKPDLAIAPDPRALWTPAYGLTTYGDLFTPRQLVAMTTFSDLIQEVRNKVLQHALSAGFEHAGAGLEDGGDGAEAYADAVALYMAFVLDRVIDRHTSIATWDASPSKLQLRNTFARQGIPMTWDFGEGNPFCDSSGTWGTSVEWVAKALTFLPAAPQGEASQMDATSQQLSANRVVSSDPPYYDNIGYADLSDFFYLWLRRSLRSAFPKLFATIAVPKSTELVAVPYRHGGKQEAESFFLLGMTQAIHKLAETAHPGFPVTIYYAFKQSETSEIDGTSSPGWETFLDAVMKAGFALTGTWPMRTELGNRMIGSGANALASSIVLVCRKRAVDAPSISRREFLRELNATLPEALIEMTGGGVNSPVAPVDLSQAMIGPGMAVFSKYSAVLESDGKPMSVRTALQLINRFLAEDDFDHDTQFCLRWFEGYGWNEGNYGEADVLARAKGTDVGGLNESGVVESGGGKIRLLRWTQLDKEWTPLKDNRTPIWEGLHQMIRALNQDGESAAGDLLAGMPMRAEPIRALSYRLYTLCERKGWAEDARSYNELIGAWSAIERAANESGQLYSQPELF